MSAGSDIPFDRLLAVIGRSAPKPWYPADFLRSTNLDAKQLGRALDEMRMAGLIELTSWEQDVGQGLQLTATGAEVLLSSRWLAKLGRGQLPSRGDVMHHGDGPDFDESTTFGRGEAIRSALLNPSTPRASYVLLGLNVVVFLVGIALMFSGRGEMQAIAVTGAVRGDLLLQGQWWRLLTSCFVHIGAFHLLMNMYALWIIGPLQERLWGRTRFLCIYLLSGLGGSCIAMSWRPEIMTAGASGCIWGLLTSQLIWVYLNRSHLPRDLVSNWGRQLGSVLLMNALISFLPGVSTGGHFGGGAAGAIVACLFHFHRFSRGITRWVSLGGMLFVPIVFVGLLLCAKDHTQRWQQVVKVHKAAKQFGNLQDRRGGDGE